MKGKALVVIFIMCFGLGACTKQIAPSSEQGFLVRIAPNGKVFNAVNCDGSALRYSPEGEFRIEGAKLVFFDEGKKERHSFLKKVNGKWQKMPIKAKIEEGAKVELEEVSQGIMAYVASDGSISNITNLDGTKVVLSESVNLSSARLVTETVRGTCCTKYINGIPVCRCQYCPGGVCL